MLALVPQTETGVLCFPRPEGTGLYGPTGKFSFPRHRKKKPGSDNLPELGAIIRPCDILVDIGAPAEKEVIQ